MFGVNLDVIFISEITFSMLFRPAGIPIFLGLTMGLFRPTSRGFTLLDLGILLLSIAIPNLVRYESNQKLNLV